jgi:hypothetical protein
VIDDVFVRIDDACERTILKTIEETEQRNVQGMSTIENHFLKTILQKHCFGSGMQLFMAIPILPIDFVAITNSVNEFRKT